MHWGPDMSGSALGQATLTLFICPAMDCFVELIVMTTHVGVCDNGHPESLLM
jgi:hypothetical protein